MGKIPIFTNGDCVRKVAGVAVAAAVSRIPTSVAPFPSCQGT